MHWFNIPLTLYDSGGSILSGAHCCIFDKGCVHFFLSGGGFGVHVVVKPFRVVHWRLVVVIHSQYTRTGLGPVANIPGSSLFHSLSIEINLGASIAVCASRSFSLDVSHKRMVVGR
jgi:hypothetical protein